MNTAEFSVRIDAQSKRLNRMLLETIESVRNDIQTQVRHARSARRGLSSTKYEIEMCVFSLSSFLIVTTVHDKECMLSSTGNAHRWSHMRVYSILLVCR